MTDLEMSALIALVNEQSAIIWWQSEQYGAVQGEPDWAPSKALRAELERRGVLPKPLTPEQKRAKEDSIPF